MQDMYILDNDNFYRQYMKNKIKLSLMAMTHEIREIHYI